MTPNFTQCGHAQKYRAGLGCFSTWAVLTHRHTKEPRILVCSSCEIKCLPSKITVSWDRGVMPTSNEVYSLFRPDFSSSTSVRECSEFLPVSINAKDEHKTKFWYINQPSDFSTLHCSRNNKLQTNTSFHIDLYVVACQRPNGHHVWHSHRQENIVHVSHNKSLTELITPKIVKYNELITNIHFRH
jgi:hypothetical protein